MTSTRREFIIKAGMITGGILAGGLASGFSGSPGPKVKLGLITDLHHDIMHDGEKRLDAFLEYMSGVKPDAIIQLGDFAYPNEKNKTLIEKFNNSNRNSLHVIGNHDTDSGHTKEQCIEVWGMNGRYYSLEVNGLQVIVLDCNDKGSPVHKGGYPSYVGQEQLFWLEEQLRLADLPVIIASHQPLAGTYQVDNAGEIQKVLSKYSGKVVLAINGHSHIDQLVEVEGVSYLHINSASYHWVGGDYKHESYAKEVHESYPWISYTCPYKDPLFALLTIDPSSGAVKVRGRKSEWVGPSHGSLGYESPDGLVPGKEIVPEVRSRDLF